MTMLKDVLCLIQILESAQAEIAELQPSRETNGTGIDSCIAEDKCLENAVLLPLRTL